jgi:hypothetical protein
MTDQLRVQCYGHEHPAKRYYTRTYSETHYLTPAEAVLLLEVLSLEDWEDGPRCLRKVLDELINQ